MKRGSFSFLMMLLSLCCWASSKSITWNNPSVLHCTNKHLQIKSIVFSDTATIVEVQTVQSKHNIQFVSDTYLQGDDAKTYKIKYCKEYPLDQYLPTKDTDGLVLTLVFDPMPGKQKTIDLIEGYGYTNFKWIGIHNTKKPLKIKPYQTDEKELNQFREKFFQSDSITIRGRFEVKPNEKVVSIQNYDQLAGKSNPIIITIKEDGTFERTFQAAHPFITHLFIGYNPISLVAVPGQTIDITVHKNGKVDYKDEKGNLSPFSHLLSSQALSLCDYSYYSHREELENLNFVEMGEKMEQMANHFTNVCNYIAQRNSFSQLEYTLLHNSATLNCVRAFLEFDLNKRFSSDSIYRVQSKNLKNYQIIRKIPHDDLLLLMYNDYYIFQNRFAFMSVFINAWNKTNVEGVYVGLTDEESDSIALSVDKQIFEKSTPSIPFKVCLLNNLQNRLRNNYIFMPETPREEREAFMKQKEEEKPLKVKNIKALLGDPTFESKADDIYNEYNKNKDFTYSLPETKGAEILKKITDQFKGKYVFLDFWATTCGPCRSSIERTKEVRDSVRKHPDVAFVFITNSKESPEKSYKAYVEKHMNQDYVFYLPYEEYEHLRELFQFSAIPHYVILDRKGDVIRSNREWYSIETFFDLLNEFKLKLD